MKTFLSTGDKKEADLTTPAYNSSTDAVEQAQLSLANIAQLRLNISPVEQEQPDSDSAFLASPIEINSLEMLEAELANQRITSLDLHSTRSNPQAAAKPGEDSERSAPTRAESCYSLAQRASLEAASWRWQARRLGIKAGNLQFLVDIRRFLLTWAEDLETTLVMPQSENTADDQMFMRKPGLSGSPYQDSRLIRSKLRYLEEIAAFLNGNGRRQENPYDRGLDVILKILSIPGRNRSYSHSSIEPIDREAGDDSRQLLLCLPVARAEFFQAVKKFTGKSS